MAYSINTAFGSPDPVAKYLLDQLMERLSAEVVTGWDEASKASAVSLSGLTASTSSYEGGGARSNTLRSSGRYAIAFDFVYGDEGVDEPIYAGVAPAAWANNTPFGAMLSSSGKASTLLKGASPTYPNLGVPVPSGERAFAYVDFDLGMVWLDNGSDTYAADREAGINPHDTFAPGTPLYFACNVCAVQNDAFTSAVTADPTYASGSFAAWG